MAKIIQANRVTHFGAAPTMIRAFAANAGQALAGDLSSLRLMITGGEAIAPEHFLWHARNFGGGRAPLVNYSGGTEASGSIVSSVILRPIPPAGFNTAAPGIEADVVSLEGGPMRGALGELVIRQPFVGMTASFWEDDARYLETYWQTIPGLWLHGDLAERDAAGNFFIRGRSDDTLKLAGKRTGPAEIEDVLMEVPGVTECAAVGIDDPAKGQALVIFAVPGGGVAPGAAAVALSGAGAGAVAGSGAGSAAGTGAGGGAGLDAAVMAQGGAAALAGGGPGALAGRSGGPADGGDPAARLRQAILDHADLRLGRAFRPAEVHLVRQLPKTRTAKVMRRLIRAAYSGLPPGDISSLENPAALDEIAALRPVPAQGV